MTVFVRSLFVGLNRATMGEHKTQIASVAGQEAMRMEQQWANTRFAPTGN